MIAAWQRLSSRDQRALRLLGGVALAALAWSLFVRPTWARTAQLRDSIATERALLARERALLERNEADASRPAPSLFTGRDDAIASAALAEHVATVAEAHDVWVQATTTGDARTTADGVRVLRVEMRAEGDVHGLAGWLAALEHGALAVRLASLEVSRAPRDESNGAEPLAVRATVLGYAAPPSVTQWEATATGTSVDRAIRPDSVAGAIVTRNPFAPSRRAPTVRYRLAIPGDALAAVDGEADADPLPPVVLGTAAGVDGASFAMCAIEGVPPTIVRVGDRIADFTVLRITRGQVTFRDARGRRIDVTTLESSDGDPP
ncbi:MAG TPA: type II secretion system protein GspM [Gemmatimonadaceae bacterium]|nr:type II secretion system protein GspM [Gemmatimonadaceae bacterium]